MKLKINFLNENTKLPFIIAIINCLDVKKKISSWSANYTSIVLGQTAWALHADQTS
jgi:hypothetical protein